MTICQLPVISYESENFLLKATTGTGRTDIHMQMKTKDVNTQNLPKTKKILSQKIPGVLKTECFNDKNLPFSKEVENTEIGHLLEHILLELLYSEKCKITKRKTEYNGNTRWNWKDEQYGSFHIEVDSGYADGKLLSDSIGIAIQITENILTS